MPTCIICLEALRDPAALPCGHVFCYHCIVKIVRSITPYTIRHFCPACRQPYTTSHVDANLVPHHLQPHVTPAVRKLHLEYTAQDSKAAAGQPTAAECDRLRAEVASMKACSVVWRKRAAVHAAATLGVVGLARIARDVAMRMKAERDDFEAKYLALQMKYEEARAEHAASTSQSHQPQPPTLPKFCDVFCDTPVPISDSRAASHTSFRMPSPTPSEESYYSDCPQCSQGSQSSGSAKRKREEDADVPLKRLRSDSLSLSPSHGFTKLGLLESYERKPLMCSDT